MSKHPDEDKMKIITGILSKRFSESDKDLMMKISNFMIGKSCLSELEVKLLKQAVN